MDRELFSKATESETENDTVFDCYNHTSYNHSGVVLAMFIVDSIGISCSLIFLMITMIYLCFVDKLQTKFQFLQLQVCLTLFLSEICIFLGFLMSPCQPLFIDRHFIEFCTFISAFQMFCVLSTFSWTFMVALHVCRLVAKECHDELLRQQHDGTVRRLTLDERALQDKVSTISREGLHRKISKDLLEVWKTNIKPLYDKEIEEVARAEERTFRSVWYIQTFASARMPLWSNFVIGYVPPAVLASLSVICQPNVEFPDKFQNWDDVRGVDMFCWPGSESRMIWYLLAYLPLLIIGTIYFRYKAAEMVRILSGGPITTVKTLSRWQRQKSGLEKQPEIESFYMEPTAIQFMVITFTCIIGLLQTLYVWVLTFFKGFVFFLHHVVVKTDMYSKCQSFLSRKLSERADKY